jgi:hypothetical protein
MATVAKKYKIGSGAWSDGTWVKPGSALVFGAATGQWTLAMAPKWYNTNNSADDGSDHVPSRPWSPGGVGGGNLRWKTISEKDHKLCVLVDGITSGTLTVNGEVGHINGYHNGRAVFRFSKSGSGYGKNVKVVHSQGGTWTIPKGASNLYNVKSQSAKASGKAKWEMTVEKYGARTDLKMHHFNWRAWHGRGTAMVMAYDGSTNGAEWVEVSGHRMAKHGSKDKGRDVWTMGSLKGTGAVHGRIMLKGKIYTFTIPRGHVIYEINLYGGGGSSSKPTNKPTSKPGGKSSGGAGSKDKYGQEHGGDEGGWADTQPGADGYTDTDGYDPSKDPSGLADIPDTVPDASEPDSGGADAVGDVVGT